MVLIVLIDKNTQCVNLNKVEVDHNGGGFTHMKRLSMAVFIIFCLILITACNADQTANEQVDDQEETGEETTNIQETEEEESDQQDGNEAEGGDGDGGESAENAQQPQAVETSSVEDTVSFTRIWWTFGSPDRKPEAGVWLYTDEEHPSNKADTFDFEENDYLLYQVSDEDLLGHDLRAKRIVLLEDDVVKIVTDIQSEPSDGSDNLEMPRQYLEVEKNVLRGKSFIIELEDGTPLSLN